LRSEIPRVVGMTNVMGESCLLIELGAIFTILWARLFLGEWQARSRLLGACVMVIGGVLVAM
jgi:drug/metabolite transporter (DMT)-like permease